MAFRETLKFGRLAESAIAQWLMRRGFAILPAYELESGDRFKGPQFYCTDASFATPDLLAARRSLSEWQVMWIEAKHKTAFSYYRKTGEWCTGIDLKSYADYIQVAKRSPWRVWLLFLHRGGQAKDSPAESPAGLYGNSLEYLQKHEHHRSDKYANGMVYWAESVLKKLAELDEVL
jgi:hypothetical protein